MYYNPELVTFHRLTKDQHGSVKGFSYITKDIKYVDIQRHNFEFMGNAFGFNVRVFNYTHEPIILCANYGSKPTIIEPNTCSVARLGHNGVLIEIISYVPTRDKPASIRITKIDVEHHILRNGVVYVSELDAYLSFMASHPAVQSQIKDDVNNPFTRESRIVPISDVISEPEDLYREYAEQTKRFIDRHDILTVYTSDLKRAKDIRISIQDNYFVPYMFNKVILDTRLEEGTFGISLNRGMTVDDSIKIKFKDLESQGLIALDPNLCDTAMGQFHEMVVFANKENLEEYFHRVKSKMRFTLENSRIPKPAVNINLTHALEKSNETIEELNEQISRLTDRNDTFLSTNKGLVSDIKRLKDEIEVMKAGGLMELSAQVVMETVQVNKAKVDNDRIDIEQKPKIKQTEATVSMFKHISDMLKSVNGIIVAGLAVVTTAIGLWVKYGRSLQPA